MLTGAAICYKALTGSEVLLFLNDQKVASANVVFRVISGLVSRVEVFGLLLVKATKLTDSLVYRLRSTLSFLPYCSSASHRHMLGVIAVDATCGLSGGLLLLLILLGSSGGGGCSSSSRFLSQAESLGLVVAATL